MVQRAMYTMKLWSISRTLELKLGSPAWVFQALKFKAWSTSTPHPALAVVTEVCLENAFTRCSRLLNAGQWWLIWFGSGMGWLDATNVTHAGMQQINRWTKNMFFEWQPHISHTSIDWYNLVVHGWHKQTMDIVLSGWFWHKVLTHKRLNVLDQMLCMKPTDYHNSITNSSKQSDLAQSLNTWSTIKHFNRQSTTQNMW